MVKCIEIISLYDEKLWNYVERPSIFLNLANTKFKCYQWRHLADKNGNYHDKLVSGFILKKLKMVIWQISV